MEKNNQSMNKLSTGNVQNSNPFNENALEKKTGSQKGAWFPLTERVIDRPPGGVFRRAPSFGRPTQFLHGRRR
jgi:hypothetical protein